MLENLNKFSFLWFEINFKKRIFAYQMSNITVAGVTVNHLSQPE